MTPEGVPDSARQAENEYDAETYIYFPVTDVLIYYTVHDDGSVTEETFYADDPSDEETLIEYMEENR